MEKLKFYIDGAWVDPATPSTLGIINPATEETFAQISLGSRQDVDRAAKAARRAFATYSNISVKDRLSYLHKIIEGFRARLPELARTMTLEMGAPITFATQRQATVALFHFEEAARVLAQYQRLRRCDAKNADCTRGDLRPRAVDHKLRHRGRGDRNCQRYAVRIGRLRAVE
jgi:aldehyde dehydrogenase (NAD+)